MRKLAWIRNTLALAVLVLPLSPQAASALSLRVPRIEYADRSCCVHANEFCPAVITPLPPTNHSSDRITVTLENFGTSDIPGPLSALFRGSSLGLTIRDPSPAVPAPIPAGGSVELDLLISLETSAPCPDMIPIELEVSDSFGDTVLLLLLVDVVDCDTCPHVGSCVVTQPGGSPLLLARVRPAQIRAVWSFSPSPAPNDLAWANGVWPIVWRPEAACQGVPGTTCVFPDPVLPAPAPALRFYNLGDCN